MLGPRRARFLLVSVVLMALVACAPSSAPAGGASGAPAGGSSSAARPAAPAAAPGAASSSAGAPATPREPVSVTVGRAAARATVAPLWIAQEQGYFSKYGLVVEETLMRSNAAIEAGMLTGELQFGFSGIAAALSSRASGGETLWTGSYLDKAIGEMSVRPDIRQPSDLRGRKVGVQSIGGTIHLRALLTVQKLGLDPEHDVQYLVAGDDPTLAQSLVAGVIDAAPISPTSAAMARANGMHGWDLGELAVPESAVSVLVTRTYAREHPQTVEAFLKGIAEGAAYLKGGQTDPAKRERSLQIVADRLRVAPDVVSPELDRIAGMARIDLAPDMANLAEYRLMVARLTPGVDQIALEDVIDVSFIQKLAREGFFDRLQAGS
jgi:NitT/TauT family transport system substrate-binding protein